MAARGHEGDTPSRRGGGLGDGGDGVLVLEAWPENARETWLIQRQKLTYVLCCLFPVWLWNSILKGCRDVLLRDCTCKYYCPTVHGFSEYEHMGSITFYRIT